MRIERRAFLGGAAATAALYGLEPVAVAGPRKPFPELTLKGSPGTVGLAHGRAFARQIKGNVGFYLRWLKRITGANEKRLLEVARGFVPVLTRHVPHQLEEMKGIARGSGRSLDEILAVNARTDMLVMGRAAVPRKDHPGCTALAMRGRVVAKPTLALGQNWDWRQDLARGIVVLRIKPDKGPRLVTFTEAGMVGKIGFNEHRLGTCLNFLSHATETPTRGYGVPVHCLLREVMACRTLEEAYKMVAWVPRCASANFLMAQPGKGVEAVDLEWTPTAVARIPLRGGLLVHTNHFKDPALAPGCPGQKGKSTLNRDATASALARDLARKVGDPVARMKKVLACRQGAPYSVSKSTAKDSPSRTLAGIVMDLTNNRLHLVAGRPHKGTWARRPGV